MSDFLTQHHALIITTLTTLLGAGGVSTLTQFGKKLLKLENERIVQILFATVAFAAAALQYLLSSKNLPPSILGVHTATLIGVATPLYFFAIKPANNFISDFKSFRQTQPSTPATGADVATVDTSPLFNDENPTASLVETGAGAPATAATIASPTATAPAEFTA